MQAPDYPLVRIKYGLLLGLAAAAPGGIRAAAAVLPRPQGGRHHVVLRQVVRRRGLGSVCRPCRAAAAAGHDRVLRRAGAGRRRGRLRRREATRQLRARGGQRGGLRRAIAGIISFVSLYVYEHPHHHCPFCLLKAEYGYQGYWLYIPLFVATACRPGSGRGAGRRPRVERAGHRSGRVSAGSPGSRPPVSRCSPSLHRFIVVRSNLILLE